MFATIDVTKVEELTAELQAMERRVEDFSVPLAEGAEFMLRDVRASFATAGASIGEKWAPLATTTIERWGDHEFGAGPTGNLLSSLQKFVRKFVCGVTTDAPHAHLFESGHHGTVSAGGTRQRHNPTRGFNGSEDQPGREFMGMTPKVEEEIITLVLDYAVGKQLGA